MTVQSAKEQLDEGSGKLKHLAFVEKWRRELALVMCILGLYGSFFFYGIMQEKIMKTKYGEENFNYPVLMVLVQCIVNTGAAKIILHVAGGPQGTNPSAPQYKFAICAFAVLCSMVFANAAIAYISYPLQVLAKSCKMIPVMLIGKVILRRTYTLREYFCVFMLTMGVILFSTANLSGEAMRLDTFGKNVGLGLTLVSLSLLFDGIGGPYAERTCNSHGTTSYELMLYQNAWSVPMLAAGFVLGGSSSEGISFIRRHPEVIKDLLVFSFSAAIGQAFVFYILRNYSALICTGVTTTRKFFTIFVSIIYYNHTLSSTQWLAISIVFGCIIWESLQHVQNKMRQQQQQQQQQQVCGADRGRGSCRRGILVGQRTMAGEDKAVEETYDDVEQQKYSTQHVGLPMRMFIAVGVFVLYSYLVMNEGAVRASRYNPEAEGFPQIALLVSAIGESLFGLAGLLVGLALLLFRAGNKMITTAWMVLAFVLGWFVFTVWVLAAPIYGLARVREAPAPYTQGQFDLMRAMSLFGGIVWCFALQGGQFMVGNIIRGYQTTEKSKGAGYAKARMMMWSVNVTLSGLFFLIAGSAARSVVGDGPLEPQVFPPMFIVYPELTITAGIVQLIYGAMSIMVAVTGRFFTYHRWVALFGWVFILGSIVWGQAYSIPPPNSVTPTTLLAGLSLIVFGNPLYSAREYEFELQE